MALVFAAGSQVKNKVELFYSGAWNDESSLVYWRDKIRITRGTPSESTTADPSQIQLTLNNRDYRFSGRNPSSPLYGLIGRNTPIRVRSGLRISDNYGMGLPAELSFDYASTPDATALDITGNIDLQAEFTYIGQWGSTVCLLSKGTTGTSNLSYALLIGTSGGVPHLTLRWSTAGSTQLFVDTPIPGLQAYAHVAVRATLTVSSGGNHIVTVYTSSDGTLGGSWNQVGTATTVAGVTSIFSGTGNVTVGQDGSTDQFRGIIHALNILNGIAGTAAANPRFNTQTAGATGFTDAAGRVWTLNGGAYIDYYLHTRMVGEVSSWPQNRDISGNDIYTPITASGVLRRLQQGQNVPAGDAMATFLMGAQPTVAFIGSSLFDLTQRKTLVPVGTPAFTYATGDLGLADKVLTLIDTAEARDANGYLQTGYLNADVSTLNTAHFGLGMVFQAAVGELGYLSLIVTSYDDGTVSREFELQIYGPTSIISLVERAFDRTAMTNTNTTLLSVGNAIVAGPTQTGYGDGLKHTAFLTLDQSGGNLAWQVYIDGASVGSGTISTANLRALWQMHLAYNPTVTGGAVAVGYLGAFQGVAVPSAATYTQPATGYLGETAADRISRLSAADSITTAINGTAAQTMLMGAQSNNGVLALMQEAAASDGGYLADGRAYIGLGYIPRTAMYDQTPQVILDYSTHIFSGDPAPTDDDQLLHNDVTASNSTGGSNEQQLTSGALSIQAPPNGVNEYATTVSVNVASDGFLPDIARWAMNLGTIDRPRWASLPLSMLNLHLTAQLYNQIADLGLTQIIQISNPPMPLPPDPILSMMVGDSETIAQDQWDLAWNALPADLYQAVGVYASTTGGTNAKYDAENSTVGTGFTSSALSASIATATGTQPWTTTAGEFPFDVNIAGERATVSAIGALSAGVQTFTFSARSVNSVVKAHLAGEAVHLWNVTRYAL